VVSRDEVIRDGIVEAERVRLSDMDIARLLNAADSQDDAMRAAFARGVAAGRVEGLREAAGIALDHVCEAACIEEDEARDGCNEVIAAAIERAPAESTVAARRCPIVGCTLPEPHDHSSGGPEKAAR
jgi:hypothetical protein